MFDRRRFLHATAEIAAAFAGERNMFRTVYVYQISPRVGNQKAIPVKSILL
jgi:hypothetical protein